MMEQKLTHRQKHSILKHPVIGSIILAAGWFLFINLCASFGKLTETFGATSGDAATHIAAVIAACLALFVHRRWFREEYRGSFCGAGLRCKDVWILMIIAMVSDFVLSILPGWITMGISAPTLTVFTTSLFAGFMEETTFRVMMISIIMRAGSDRKHIRLAFWMSTIIFGLVHLANGFSNPDPVMIPLQVLSSATGGMLFAAVYLRTGNIALTIGYHFLHDVFAFMIQTDSNYSGLTASDIVCTLIYSIVLVIVSFLLMRGKQEEIAQRWDERWSRNK